MGTPDSTQISFECANFVVGLIALIVGTIMGVATAYRWGYKRGESSAKKAFDESIRLKRFRELYSPLKALFITRHVCVWSVVMYPFLSRRSKNALSKLKRMELGASVKALFDKGRTPEREGCELLNDEVFPLGEVFEIIDAHKSLADEELLNLYMKADAARSDENGNSSSMLPQEYDLLVHIHKQHSKLVKKFAPKE